MEFWFVLIVAAIVGFFASEWVALALLSAWFLAASGLAASRNLRTDGDALPPIIASIVWLTVLLFSLHKSGVAF